MKITYEARTVWDLTLDIFIKEIHVRFVIYFIIKNLKGKYNQKEKTLRVQNVTLPKVVRGFVVRQSKKCYKKKEKRI